MCRDPTVPLYMLGARMLEVIPLVPLGGNLSVGVAALSYNGLFTIGVLVDPVACPDAGVFTEGIARCFTQLLCPGQGEPRDGGPRLATLPPIVRHRQGHFASPGTCP